ncbi:MAG: hypothetical protein K6F64_08940 [Clostridia bacterium]|nr:hypothetical protein [Clostridia bacterium]
MKKITSFLLSALIIVLTVSAGVSAAGPRTKPAGLREYRIDYTNPYNPAVLDKNGNKVRNFAEGRPSRAGKAHSVSDSAVPAKYDARDSGLVTQVKDQEFSNSCWSFAATSCFESDAISKGFYTAENADFSEAHLTWFSTKPIDPQSQSILNEGVNSSSPYDEAGSPIEVLNALYRWEGIALERDYPFRTLKDSLPESARYDCGSGLIVDEGLYFSGEDLNEIKQWILNHGSCYLAFYAEFEDDGTGMSKVNENYYYDGSKEANHAVAIIGWDDSYPRESFVSSSKPEKDGAWLVKNSWGDVGEDGYIWISYYDSSLTSFVGLTVREKGDRKYLFNYNGFIPNGFIGYQDSFRIANVFDVDAYSSIGDITYLSAGEGDKLDIEVYKLGKSFSAPDQGMKLYSNTVSGVRTGYNTFYLDTPLTFAPGDRYSVVITITASDPDEGAYAAVECENGESLGYRVNIEKGQSYYYDLDKEKWNDIASLKYGNFFISATASCAHSWQLDVVIPATCTEDGIVNATCSICGKSEQQVLAKGHKFEPVFNNDASDSDYGTETLTCTVCGEKGETRKINKIKFNTNWGRKAKYRSVTDVTVTAENPFEDYYLVVLDENGDILAYGSQSEVSFRVENIKEDAEFTVKAVDAGLNEKTYTDGTSSSETFKVEVNRSFFARLGALLLSLIGRVSYNELKPE